MELRRCLACGRVGAQQHKLCTACLGAIGFDGRLRCYVCARPLRGLRPEAVDLCQDCRTGIPLGRVVGLGLHRPPLSTLIHRFKFQGEYGLAPVLGALLTEAAQQALVADGESAVPWTLLVPVPMHPARERARGYNQAAMLAHAMGAVWKLPVDTTWLVRTQDTGSQVHRTGMLRRRELADAFGVARARWWQVGRMGTAPPWRGQAVLLVDDVYTTGSTAQSCAHVMMKAGVARVDLGVLAISGRSTP